MASHVVASLPTETWSVVGSRRAGLIVMQDGFGFLDVLERKLPPSMLEDWATLRDGWVAFPGLVSEMLSAKGVRLRDGCVGYVQEGHPSALAALGVVEGWLSEGLVDCAILVAASSSCDAPMIELFTQLGLFQEGMIPSEACAIALVEPSDGTRSVMLGPVGLGHEAADSTLGTSGDGLAQACSAALVGNTGFDSLEVITDLTGERWRAKELMVARTRSLSGTTDALDFAHLPMWTGDIGAASALVALLFASYETLHDDRPRLITSCTRGPGRGALLVTSCAAPAPGDR